VKHTVCLRQYDLLKFDIQYNLMYSRAECGVGGGGGEINVTSYKCIHARMHVKSESVTSNYSNGGGI